MVRIDTERVYNYSNTVFNALNIYDLKGHFKDGGVCEFL